MELGTSDQPIKINNEDDFLSVFNDMAQVLDEHNPSEERRLVMNGRTLKEIRKNEEDDKLIDDDKLYEVHDGIIDKWTGEER